MRAVPTHSNDFLRVKDFKRDQVDTRLMNIGHNDHMIA